MTWFQRINSIFCNGFGTVINDMISKDKTKILSTRKSFETVVNDMVSKVKNLK